MSEHNTKKIRICKTCGARSQLTAAEIKGHALNCSKRKKMK